MHNPSNPGHLRFKDTRVERLYSEVMDKRKLRHYLGRLRAIPGWLFLSLAIIFLIISVFALRANNQKMIGLRAAVFNADVQNDDVETALRELREHVHAHMNTDLASGPNAIRPPIQLKYRYERLLAAEQEKLGSVNEKLYTDAQNHCEQQNPEGFSGGGRIPCIKEYIDTHGGATLLADIPEDLYKFDFASPRWSPDLAGWSLIISGVCFVIFFFQFGSSFLIKRELHKHA